jgi:ABC-type transport system involved in multi-copper enzyme maturation permease subunit
MLSLHNIHSIAKYEIKTLLRSWFFRIFAIIALLFLFLFNLGTLIDPGSGAGNWEIKALPSIIPYVNLLMLNVVQAIVVIFLSSDFLKRDKKLDTTDVIYVRPMTNGEYVAGKVWGNLIVFVILNAFVLSESLIFNLIAEGVGLNLKAYLYYFLVISVPTLIYILGFSVFLMSILRNQAVTFVVLLGYVALSLFYLANKFYYFFDYMAFNIPLTYSDFVGFGNWHTIWIHRGMYVCFGLAFILLSVSLLKRLPQSQMSNKISLVPAVLFFAGGIWLGFEHVGNFRQNQELRSQMRTLNDDKIHEDILTVKSYQISLEHLGSQIACTARLDVSNESGKAIDKTHFSLNPGLTIEKVLLNGTEIHPERNLHLVNFSGLNLQPGDSASIEFTYRGTINEAACYLELDDKAMQEEKYGQMMYRIDKRHAFVLPEYVLLTREDNWYPVPFATFGKQNKEWMQKQFSRFEVQVKTLPGLTAISQGEPEQNGNLFKFNNKKPLSQVSVIIGPYKKKSQKIDGLDFNLYLHPGHDYFSKYLEEINDTIPGIIAESLKDFERTVDCYYPFARFTLVEVPVQFYSYERILIGERDQIQPEMVFFPEKGVTVRDADFAGSEKRMARWGRGDFANMTAKDKKVTLLQNFLSNFTQSSGRPNFSRSAGQVQVTEKKNPTFVFPLFYNYAYYIKSDKWPITDRIFESYKKEATQDQRMGFMREMQGTSENEKANLALVDHSFAELLNDPDQTQIIDNVIQMKGQALFSIIKRKAGDDAFNEFLYNYLRSVKFKATSIEDFSLRIKEAFGVDLIPYMESWFNSKQLPGYLISNPKAVNVMDGDRLKTMVKFKVTNTENTEGIIRIEFRIGDGGGPGRFMGGGSNTETVTKLIQLDANQTKEISYLLDGNPRGMSVNTLTSRNIPSEMRLQLGNIEEDKKAVPFEGEKIVDKPVTLAEEGEIILDNEDKGFRIEQSTETSLLQKLLIKEENSGEKYVGFSSWRAPRDWRATTSSNFFGKFIRSAYYIRSGDGSKKAIWNIPLKEKGFYEVYAFIDKEERRGGPPGRGGGDNSPKGEYTFTIYHDDGKEDVTVDLNTADTGWNSLGAFYFSPDSVVVELSNKSTARLVIADAVKLVKQ